LHQLWHVPRGFTPGYYLSRFQRSESHLSNHPQNPAGSGKLIWRIWQYTLL
jgi:hypothetical protein